VFCDEERSVSCEFGGFNIGPRQRKSARGKAAFEEFDRVSALHPPADQCKDVNDKKCGREQEIAEMLAQVKSDQHRKKENE